jgi:hypothetical protein
MPYRRFLFANASGGIIWATGITYLIWFLGAAAERWLSRASWIGLVAAVLASLLVTLLIRRKTRTLTSPIGWRADGRARRAQTRQRPIDQRPALDGGQAAGAAARRVASTVLQGMPGGSRSVTTSAACSQASSCSRS